MFKQGVQPSPLFIVSEDGVLGREVNVLNKRLAEQIAFKWEKSLVTGCVGIEPVLHKLSGEHL